MVPLCALVVVCQCPTARVYCSWVPNMPPKRNAVSSTSGTNRAGKAGKTKSGTDERRGLATEKKRPMGRTADEQAKVDEDNRRMAEKQRAREKEAAKERKAARKELDKANEAAAAAQGMAGGCAASSSTANSGKANAKKRGPRCA